MYIRRLGVNYVRNIEQATVNGGEGCNLIFGENGAGKSSFLEAIGLAATGKSFRSGNPNLYTTHNARYFQVEIEAITRHKRRITSRARRKDNARSVFLNGKRVSRSTELARQLPLLVFSHETLNARISTSDARRSLLDWLLFHVEPSHGGLLKSYRHAMEQYRHALSKRDQGSTIWITELVKLAHQIDQNRLALAKDLASTFGDYVSRFSGMSDATLNYRKGWSENEDLAGLLIKYEDSHRKLGYVNIGPHRADLQLRGCKGDVKTWCSRGQLKAIHFLLMLSLIALFELRTGETPILLLDDMWAEIDRQTGDRLISLLQPFKLQFFVSALEDCSSAISFLNPTVFHVEQGRISKAK